MYADTEPARPLRTAAPDAGHLPWRQRNRDLAGGHTAIIPWQPERCQRAAFGPIREPEQTRSPTMSPPLRGSEIARLASVATKIMAMSRHRPLRVAVGSAEFKARCLELVDRVKESRAEFVVTRHGRPVAKLVPVDAVAPASLVGSMANSVLRYEGPFDPVPAAWSLDEVKGQV